MSVEIDRESSQAFDAVVIGAGPAGLTAALELQRRGRSVVVLEGDEQVGGISRTVERDGWRFDLGGHRFFTKVERVSAFWHGILGPDDFLIRPRMSRIYFEGKFYDYPLKATNALRNLGLIEASLCMASYIRARLHKRQDTETFEDWVASRFGWRLYRKFFKTYTEKVWGVPAREIQSDWAAQRIKNLSLGRAVISALSPKGKKHAGATSLIEQFEYPKYGPGMMWERCADLLSAGGIEVRLGSGVIEIERASSETSLMVVRADSDAEVVGRRVISSMPLGELVLALRPVAPDPVVTAAKRLRHRDFLTVALVVPRDFGFPDNWIYIHEPGFRVGRIQNFGSWSSYMVSEGHTCLGLEYFVDRGDDLWNSTDEELVGMARRELEGLGLVPPGEASGGYVVRVPQAYPVYDAGYSESVDVLRQFLESNWPEIQAVGRNGMHRYNNQDHSMLTAMLAVENIVDGTEHDLWSVNVEDEYHEEVSQRGHPTGTGRAAPVLPS